MFQGIFTAVVTPMAADGALLPDLWAAQVERQVAAGIHGLIIGGTTGEFYALSAAERVGQFKAAGEILGKRTPWLAGVNAITTAEVIHLANAAKAAGASGLLLGAPPYVSPTELELARHCLAVDAAVGMPIVLYNYPARTNADMGREFFQHVRGRRNFVAIKESTGNMKRAQEMMRDYPEIALCCGSEDLALDFFALGAKMWICAVSNFAPELILRFYRACVEDGDFVLGRKLSQELAGLTYALEEGGKFIASVKYACSRAGICSPDLRAPLLPINQAEREALDALLDGLKAPIQSAA